MPGFHLIAPAQVTGSVSVENVVQVTGSVTVSGFSLSASLASQVDQGNSGSQAWKTELQIGGLPISPTNPVPISGSIAVTPPAVQNVTGSDWIPTITGSVKITEIVLVTGSIGLSAPVTGAFRLTEAATVLQHAVTISGSVPLIVTGSVSSGSVIGLLVGGQPASLSNPVPITGSVSVVGQVVISGSTQVSGSVGVSGSVTVYGPGSFAARAGFCFGKLDTSVAGVQLIEHTTYTEMTGNFRVALVSASGTDSNTSTGAKVVRVTYYDLTGSGPFTEDVQMNGTTPVPLSASSTCYIESMFVLNIGSYTTNKGTISLKLGPAGTGGTVWSILGNHGRTYGAHHYVPSGTTCFITSLYGSKFNNTSQGSGGTFYLTYKDLVSANAAERQISDYLNAYGQSSAPARTYGTPVRVNGLAKIQLYVFPDSALTTTYIGSFDFYEQDNT